MIAEASSSYGLMAEFTTPEAVLEAARRAREEGYTSVDAYSPYPVHGLAEALGRADHRVPWIVFVSGVMGAFLGYGLQWYVSAVDYPVSSGARPYNSWPSFIPVTFELTVLCAAFGALIGMLALNGLPRPYHPVFNAPGFGRASTDRFFLSIEAADPNFDADDTRRFLEGLKPVQVSEVPQ
jgi:hypothetical protein